MEQENERDKVYGDITSRIEGNALENKAKLVLDGLYGITNEFRAFYEKEDYLSAIDSASLLDKLYSNYNGLLKQFVDYSTSNPVKGIGEAVIPFDTLEKKLEELDFSQRAFNCLRRAGLLDLRTIARATEADLGEIRGFGKKSQLEVRDKLEEYGLKLKSE